MKYIFIDAEYAFTCSSREGQHPNYKNILEALNREKDESVKLVYHVGNAGKKRGVSDFLTKSGVDYNIILEFELASKTQLVGAQMGIDVMRYCQTSTDATFTFLTGDDYLIPIIAELLKYDVKIEVFYFPAIFSHELSQVLDRERIKAERMSTRYFTFPRIKNGN